MRICKDIQKLNAFYDNVVAPVKDVKKEPVIYTCFGCKYESTRQYNVERHEERIHWKQRRRECCGEKFFTKGDYYVHCEQIHPETRLHAITSRMKYKITGDSVGTIGCSKLRQVENSKQEKPACNVQLRRRFSERIRIKEHGKVQSKVRVKYSVTYSDVDIENIPLISFLTDRRLKSYLKKLSSSKLSTETGGRANVESSQTVKFAISSEENVENGNENIRTTVSNSSVSSFSVELPTKKLILHRFRRSVMHEFQIPLREQNNNNRNQVNLAETQTTETASVFQSWSRNSKRPSKANAENVSKFAFSLEQQLNIKLDRGITVPMVTQVHRDFLSSIDFDQYKIF